MSVREKEYFQSLGLLAVEELHDKRIVEVLKTMMYEGEAGTIVLALKKKALSIIDDLKGQETDVKLGPRITLGLLEFMKQRGLDRRD